MKKISCFILCLILFITITTRAQVGINTDGSSPDPSAMLDIKSDTMGLLIPRMSFASRESITQPAQGLLIFQTDNDPGFYYNANPTGTPGNWIKIIDGDISLSKIQDSDDDTQLMANDSDKIFFNTDGERRMTIMPDARIGIGMDPWVDPNPSAILELASDTLGLLIPRMTSSNRAAIPNPANGLMVYDLNSLSLWYFNGGSWVEMGSGSGGGSASEIRDADNDTKIQVEATTDDDQIYFYTAGNNVMHISNTGRVMIGNEIELTNTTSSNTGVIYKGGYRFIHNNRAVGTDGANTFVGKDAGNFSDMTGSSSDASYNAGFGAGTLNDITTGGYNTAIGAYAMYNNETGNNNVALGTAALYRITSGANNTALGQRSGYNNYIGSGNVFIGNEAGYNESGSNKLYIDNSNTASPLIYGDFSSDALTINGTLQITGGSPGDGKVLTSDANGLASWQAVGGGDNLGNHTMTQNLVTATNYISSDGSNEGIYLNSGTKKIDFRDYDQRIIKYFGTNDPYPGIEIYSGHESSPETDVNAIISFNHLWPNTITWHYANISGIMENVTSGNYAGGMLFQTRDQSNGYHDMIYLSGEGKMGVLTKTPTAELEVNGQVKITGGSPGAGKVLTSDANGLASWQSTAAIVTTIDGLDDGISDVSSVYLGYNSGVVDDGDNKNTAIGIESLNANTSGYYNTAVGFQSLNDNVSGAGNTAVGYKALFEPGIPSNNTAIGAWAMENTTTGHSNTAIGSGALQSNTSGDKNIAFGYYALNQNTKGNNSIAIGDNALQALTEDPSGYDQDLENVAIGYYSQYTTNPTGGGDGRWNVSLGTRSMRANTSGAANTALGHEALYSNKAKYGSVAVGYRAMYYAHNTTTQDASNNTAVGVHALLGSDNPAVNSGTENSVLGAYAMEDNTSGSENVAIGDNALHNNRTGDGNIAVGKSAMVNCEYGEYNCAIGHWAMASNSHGFRNVAIGQAALFNSNDGYDNIGIGHQALYWSYDSKLNIAIGKEALRSTNFGDTNIAIGFEAMHENLKSSSNIAIGTKALYSFEGHEEFKNANNIAIGTEAMYSLESSYGDGLYNVAIGNMASRNSTGGSYNVAIGQYSLSENTNFGNTAVGAYTLFKNTFGSNNTAIGYDVLYENLTGTSVTAVGTDALYNNTTGGSNTAIGRAAGDYNKTGRQLTFLGAYSDASSDDLVNATAIGYFAEVNADNKVVIGNTSVSTIGGYASWSNYSDKRLKENIVYTDQLGLEFISNLHTVSYNYIDDENKRRRDGLIAQDVQQVLSELGIEFSGLIIDDDEQQTMNLSYTEFVIPLINAVQELEAENNELEVRLSALEEKISGLSSQ